MKAMSHADYRSTIRLLAHVQQGAWIALCEMEADESVKFGDLESSSCHGKRNERNCIITYFGNSAGPFLGCWVYVDPLVSFRASFCWVLHTHQLDHLMGVSRYTIEGWEFVAEEFRL